MADEVRAKRALLHAPEFLEEMLTPRSRLRVARLLVRHPEKRFTGREMARMTGQSHAAVQEAVRALVEKGLVHQWVFGRSHVYQLDPESFFSGVAGRLVDSEREMARAMEDDLLAFAVHAEVISAVVFGSFARGEADSGSDLDLLIITRDIERSASRLGALETRFLRRYHVRVSAKLLAHPPGRSVSKTPYVRAALREGLLISGVPLREVIRGGA